MSSWIQRQISSHRIAATAVVTGVAVAGTIFGAQAIRRKVAVEDLKSSIPDVDEKHHTERVHHHLTSHSSALYGKQELPLTIPVKLTDFGAASPTAFASSKEDERAATLARRAQQGDYDEGIPRLPTSSCPSPRALTRYYSHST